MLVKFDCVGTLVILVMNVSQWGAESEVKNFISISLSEIYPVSNLH